MNGRRNISLLFYASLLTLFRKDIVCGKNIKFYILNSLYMLFYHLSVLSAFDYLSQDVVSNIIYLQYIVLYVKKK